MIFWRKTSLNKKQKNADSTSRIYFEEAGMKKEKNSGHALQPECKNCRRFAILKSPCSPDACIFRETGNNRVI